MKRKIILPVISGTLIIFLSGAAVVNSAGTYGWTGSPVDGGAGIHGQCSACHNGGTSGTPTMAMSASPAFGGSGTTLTYSPSTTYTITITPSGSYARYGMNCEIINSLSSSTSAVAMFGTFGSAVTSNCQIYSSSSTSPYPPCVSHKSNSTTTPYNFVWTAPASGTGYLFTDVLGANNNGATTGDQVSAVYGYTLTAASSAGISSIHQNNDINLSVFPNPATDKVSITYTLKGHGNVSIKLYNLNGELITDLLNETQEVGVQKANAQLPSGLAKGIYILKLVINGELTTERVIVN